MSLPSCLGNDSEPLVIDASVAINLVASGIGDAVLRALPCKTFIVDMAAQELEPGRGTGTHQIDELNRWASGTLIEIISLDDSASELFESLVIGPAADTLDDGEAATIAVAVARRHVPVIDERKANRICRTRFPDRPRAATIDLFAQQAVVAALGAEVLGSGVFSALMGARMRVLPHHLDWTIGLIGHQRALQCQSLPRSARSNLQE